MTARHSGRRLGIGEFAARANIETDTLRAYINRPLKTNPVPEPCWLDPVRCWCERHADLWVANRPRKQKEQQ